jgi:hypothetical protein
MTADAWSRAASVFTPSRSPTRRRNSSNEKRSASSPERCIGSFSFSGSWAARSEEKPRRLAQPYFVDLALGMQRAFSLSPKYWGSFALVTLDTGGRKFIIFSSIFHATLTHL